MARARNIKPSFFDNDLLAESEPLGRLLFIGLWTICDFNGNLEWRSKRVKKQLLAYDNCDIEKLAINLDKNGFIRFYSDRENMYVNIVNFAKHQNPHKNERAKGSEIPVYTNEHRQVVDLNTLTINHDLSGLNQDCSTSNRASSLIPITDSLIPNPESLILNPDTPIPESVAKASQKSIDFSMFNMTKDEISEVRRIRTKNKGGALTQRIVNALAKEFNAGGQLGYSLDDMLTEWEVRGWKSFKADWMKGYSSSNNASRSTKKDDNLNKALNDMGISKLSVTAPHSSNQVIEINPIEQHPDFKN